MDESVAEEENQVPFFGALFQSATKSSESKKDLLVDESVAVEENQVSFLGALFQSVAKANENKEDLQVDVVQHNPEEPVEEEGVMVTDKVSQRMDEDVVTLENLSQATVADAVKERQWWLPMTECFYR
ncbi:hypothetical protein ACQJBY_011649 [Aegilops geniculata]